MIARLLALAIAWAVPAAAQELGGLARVDPLESRIADTDGGAEIALSLSQPVPYRLYTLVAPPRLLIEFREVDFVGLEPADLLRPGAVAGIGFDRPRPGWTRLTAELARPMGLVTAGMATDADTGRARLRVSLEPVDADRFLAGAGAPEVAGLPAANLAGLVRGHPRCGHLPMMVYGRPKHPSALRAAGIDDVMRSNADPAHVAQRIRDRVQRF